MTSKVKNGLPADCLEFHMTTVCDLKCVFCSEWPLMKAFGKYSISYASIVKTLIRKRRDGCSRVIFTGGEPTLHPRFPEVLQAAKRLRYATCINTDATRLADPDFCAKALPFIDEISVSIHGDCPEIQDSLSGVPGSFDAIMAAFRNIGRFKAGRLDSSPFVRTNMVLTNTNVGRLLATAQLISSFGFVWQFTVSNLCPVGNALKDYLPIVPRLKDIAPSVGPLWDLSARTGMKVKFYRLPLCILGGHEDLSDNEARVKIRRARLGSVVGLIEENRAPEIKLGRMNFLPPKCSSCELKDYPCPGVFRPYYKKFGDSELEPVRRVSMGAHA